MKKYKWWIYWSVYAIVFISYLISIFCWWDSDFGSVYTQTAGLTITLIAMVLIMLQNSEQITEATEKEIKSIQVESANQINAIGVSTEKHLKEIQENTQKQIQSFIDQTDKHITAIQKESEKQLKAIDVSTREQINELQNSTNKHVEELNKLTKKQIDSNRRETKKQIENFNKIAREQTEGFIAQTDNIISSIEILAEEMAKSTQLNEESRKQEEENIKKEEEKWLHKIERQKQEDYDKQAEKQRHQPILFFRTKVIDFLLWRSLRVYVYNNGGAAHNIQFHINFNNNNNYYRVKKLIFNMLNREVQDFKILGLAKLYDSYNQIGIQIAVYDEKERKYVGEANFRRNDDKWQHIKLKEQIYLS